MSVFELLGIVGLVVAVYVAVRSTGLNRRRGAARTAGGSSHSASKKEFVAAYVSETPPAYFQYVRRRHRFEMHCPVRYFVNGHIGEGFVVDMI